MALSRVLAAGAGALLVITGAPWVAVAAPVTGNATHFDALGAPYGGCGLPQDVLDSQDFVALNVYNTPGDYSFYPRPLPPSQAGKIGLWDNGRNCGRFVQVTIGDYCTGTNDGAPGQPFCRNGSWISDSYNGATLTMVVADSCGDSNAWCRDDPNHLDLATPSLNRFVKNGVPVGDLNPGHWNNRHVSWSFVPSPNYTGDIRIGFLQGAQRYWPAIAVSHLPNGIHGVEYLAADGSWQQAQPDSDMGEAFIIGPATTAGTGYQIRVRDASDALLNNGRVYNFTLPSQCSANCSAAYTSVTYTTGTGDPTTPPPPPPPGGCSATAAVTGSWPGGFQLAFTVKNTGASAIAGWNTSFSFPAGQQLASSWNATATQSGQQVTAANQAYNGTLAAGASTTWGATVNGANQPLTNLACAARPAS
ncbi:cellulose binding domain-containing protein [Actinocrispum sp. NPDC049592]|uniref:cellulose binding domain-containing protein n=1 Tax=Actinocrispum sp. NPDC049592 TaxID=3154835 RepID=UPI0034448522